MPEANDDRQKRRIQEQAEPKGWVLVPQGKLWALIEKATLQHVTHDAGLTLDEAEAYVKGEREAIRLYGRHL